MRTESYRSFHSILVSILSLPEVSLSFRSWLFIFTVNRSSDELSSLSLVQSYLVRYTSPQLLIEPFIHTAQISNWLYMPIVKWWLLLLSNN